MKNKIVVNVYSIYTASKYEIYVPTNESIKKVLQLVLKIITEVSDGRIPSSDNYCLFNPMTGVTYNYAQIVRDTDIVNNTNLVLF